MKLKVYYRTFGDADIYDGEITVRMSEDEIRCAPNEHAVNDAVADLIPYFAPQGPLEWSCSREPHAEGEWLSLTGNLDDYYGRVYRYGERYFEITFHGPVQVLRRFEKAWNS